jgi:L-arabinose isomerase
MENTSTLKIGLFGIGLHAYREQFKGLKDRLEGYLHEVEEKLAAIHPNIVNAGLVDSVDRAFEAGSRFKKEGVDLIFLYVSTYALSSTVLPVVQRAKVPVIILNLSPEAAIDYEAFNTMTDRTRMTGEWLAFCPACPVPEIANILLYNRMGCMGHYYSGMLDIYSDLTRHYAHFGGHIELIEVEELASLRKTVTGAACAERVELFYKVFDVQPDCSKEELEKAATTSVALDKLVRQYSLGSMAYYYKGTGNPDNEEAINSIILGNSWLTANGIPVAEHQQPL